ncbi:MAG: hypothetical protein Q4B31_01575 [Clostridia bacterium]|nr:hypothetical protein [Clostridia bacterium]
MYRKYYSQSDMPIPLTPKNTEIIPKNKPLPPQKPEGKNAIENDDLILIAVFLLLIMNDCEDKLLLLAIAYLFFMKG